MLAPEQVELWVRERGPWLYWSFSNERLWPWILRDGIQPQDVAGVPTLLAGMEPRPGHIYFMTDPTPRARFAAFVGNEPQVRVHMGHLDRANFACDEDRIGAHRPLASHRDEVKALPRRRCLSARQPGMKAGDWMNLHADIVDQPEWVWHSMHELTVAYLGGVPADVLDILPLHVLDDWEPADAGETYVEVPDGKRPAHYLGDMAALAR